MHLKLDMWESPQEHPLVLMKRLGITYQHATAQSLYDCWWFWNCENVPNPLPKYLSVLNFDPKEAIGHGLTEAMAAEITRAIEK